MYSLKCTAYLLLALFAGVAQAMTLEQRQALDLSRYTVNNPDASYFSVKARRKLLQVTNNDMFMQQQDALANRFSCREQLAQPVLREGLRLPSFYPKPDAWREASRPYFAFEDTVTGLAGAYMTSGDGYYADCLVRYLDRWASQQGLEAFYYQLYEPQAWYATESMIFAAAMAYSIVRPATTEHAQQQRIERWLNRLAHRHMAIPGRSGGSCCNNHFYRRALYASMVGVLTEDNTLFQFGVSAIYSALSEMTPEGGFPRELMRGRRALHYQNYGLLYLITNMEIIARQGYDIYQLEIDGHTIHDGIALAIEGLETPEHFSDQAGETIPIPKAQYQGFIRDGQYFAWMEIYLSRFDNPRLDAFLRDYRPVYNRSAGGYTTLYFMAPDRQRRSTPTRIVPGSESPMPLYLETAP
ncbi:MAG TPA: alginate lyase family protein [Halomonas sp.]|nr:alginate lyase family protein [Halomonas sp.]